MVAMSMIGFDSVYADNSSEHVGKLIDAKVKMAAFVYCAFCISWKIIFVLHF